MKRGSVGSSAQRKALVADVDIGTSDTMSAGRDAMTTAVPRELVGASENVESLPDREDRMWEVFDKGREVLTRLENLEIGQSVLCKFRGVLIDLWNLMLVYHGTKLLSLVRILRGAVYDACGRLDLPMMETVREGDATGVYVTPVDAFKSYSHDWH